jgi:hypothetical protein
MAKKAQVIGAITWLHEVEKHDYLAARSYLLLIYGDKQVAKLVSKLRGAEVTEFKAKDIFRASELPLLDINNFHVEVDRKKIKDGIALSPLLLVRDKGRGKVVIADGYHRLCAIYSFDEDAQIKVKII